MPSLTVAVAPQEKGPLIRHHVPGGTEHGGGIGRLVGYVMATEGAQLRHVVQDTRGPELRVLGSSLRLLQAMVAIGVASARGQPGLEHLHIAGRGSTLRKLILGQWARLLGRPYVLHLHDYDYAADFVRRPRWLRRAIRRLFQGAAQVIVLGQRDAATATSLLGVRPGALAILRNCVPDPGPRQQAAGTEARILFLGRLSARKGVPELLEALADPQLQALPWRAVLAGDGAVAESREALRRSGIADRVSLPGWVDASDAARLREAADILVLPSHAEGFAMAVIEGLAHGLAVITTPVGAHDEVLADDRNCLLVPPGDVPALVIALRRLIGDPALRARLGITGRQLYETGFAMTGYLHRLEALDGAALPVAQRLARQQA
jgi:glycosyltransferase involved in cell wall biosynthesis